MRILVEPMSTTATAGEVLEGVLLLVGCPILLDMYYPFTTLSRPVSSLFDHILL